MTTRTVALLLSSAVSVAISLAAFAEPAPAPAPARRLHRPTTTCALPKSSSRRKNARKIWRRYLSPLPWSPPKTRDLIGIETIQDMTNFTPGLAYTTSLDRAFIRGVGRETNNLSTNPGVATYSDGQSTTPASSPLRAMRCSRIESKFCADRRAPCTAATPSPAPSIPFQSGRPQDWDRRGAGQRRQLRTPRFRRHGVGSDQRHHAIQVRRLSQLPRTTATSATFSMAIGRR